MNRVSGITVCQSSFRDEEEFKRKVGEVVMLLLECGNIATVRYDEPGLGIVHMDYNYADQSFGAPYPYWLTPEQAEMVETEEDELRARINELETEVNALAEENARLMNKQIAPANPPILMPI